MRSRVKWFQPPPADQIQQSKNLLFKPSLKNQQKILKLFLLSQLHQLFYEIFKDKLLARQNHSLMEYYTMDKEIIQFLIKNIIETGEYTLEGIAYYTHVPFDVIYDAACGVNNEFSITPWTRIVDLYLQVKPDVAQMLTKKLLDMNEKNQRDKLLSL